MLEWVQSERSSLIPKLNGQLLCSTIDPVIEGRRWAEKVTSVSRDWEAFFVLGLGGGYHVSALAAMLPHTEVIVIEANRELATELLSRRGPMPSNVTVLSGLSILELENQVFVSSGLRSLYGVARHTSSFRLSREYFQQVESLMLGRRPIDILRQCDNRKGLSNFLKTLDLFQDKQFSDAEVNIIELHHAIQRRGKPLEKEAMVFMVLRELVK